MAEFQKGDRVECDRGKGVFDQGVIAFYGEVKFSDGIWVGIILDEPRGKNNGTVNGCYYFECPENHGTFVRPDRIRVLANAKPTGLPKPRATGIKPPASVKRPSSVKPSPATSLRPTPQQTPKVSPAVSTEQLAKPTPTPQRTQNEPPKMPRVPEAETPKPQLPPPIEPIQQPPQTATEPAKQLTQKIPVDDTPTNVKEIAKKLDKEPAAIFKPQESFYIGETDSETNDVIVQKLRDEIDDLKSQLNTLRDKSTKDKRKLEELDRVRINCQALLEFKTSILEEQRILRQKYEETLAELGDSKKRAEELEATISQDLKNQLEMVTLDKLVAEERIEVLQRDLDEQNHRIMFLETEVALQNSNHAPVPTGNVDQENDNMTYDSGHSDDIREQMDRYREAIIQMRDFVTTANLERDDFQQRFEQSQAECDRLENENNRLLDAYENISQEVIGLHEQLDAALGSIQMVEHLTEKNLDLEDKVRSLTDEKEQLEELVQLNEEIAEAARDAQLDLRKEFDNYIVHFSEKCNDVASLENQIAEYDNVVQKFRQKIVDMNNEIVDYRDRIHVLEHQLDERHVSGSTNTTAIFSSNRNFSDRIASELNTLELESLNQLNKYLRTFLSDNFAKPGNDLDCVLLVVFFPKLASKANLLSRLLGQKFPDLPDGMQREHVVKSNKAEQWANVRKFSYYLHVLGSVASRFETMLSNCTFETLSRLALQRTEITNQEKFVDQYFDLLKDNRFDENTSVDSLNHASALLQKIFSVNVSATEYDTRKAFSDYLQQFYHGLQWIRLNCDRLKLYIFDNESEGSATDFIGFISGLSSTAERIQSQILHAQKWIPTDKMLDLSHDVSDIVLNGVMLLEKIASILHDTSSLAISRLVTNDTDGFTTGELKEFLQSVVEKREGRKTADEAVDEVRSSMNALDSCIEEIATKLENHLFELPLPTERSNPLVERSQTLKQNTVDAENLRWEVSKKEEKIHQHARALKNLNDELSMIKIQLERERKKATKTGHDDGLAMTQQSEQLQEALSNERYKYEQENNELRERVVDLEKRLNDKEHQIKRSKAAAAFMDPTTCFTGRTDLLSSDTKDCTRAPQIAGFQQTPAELLHSLHLAHERIRRLQADLDERRLSALQPLNLSVSNVCGAESLRLRNITSTNSTEQIELRRKALLDESNILTLECKELSAVPTEKRTNDTYRRRLADYTKRAIDLRVRTRAFAQQNYPHIPMPSSLKFSRPVKCP